MSSSFLTGGDNTEGGEMDGEDIAANVRVGVVRYRWIILVVFAIQNMVNSIIWICFASIQTTITEYYQISTTKANLLSLMFVVSSLPGYPATIYLQERYGLRKMMYVGVIAQILCGWVRYAGQSRNAFGVCLLGSIIGGPSMAVFGALPSKLSSSWFPTSERTIATTIAALSGVLGVLAGFVIGPAIIHNPDDVPKFLLVQAIIPTAAGLTMLFVRKSPPMPATISETVAKLHIKESLHEAFTNKGFVLLLVGFTLGLGCFNALSTLIDQIVHPLGYSEDDSSLFGGLLIGLGLVGAGILGYFVEKTHKYKVAMMISIWGCALSVIWCTLALHPHNKNSITTSFAFIGLFGLALLPLSLECGCELLFPVPEVVANGILMFCGQTFGVVIVFVMDAMKEETTGKMTSALWLLFSLLVSSAFCITIFPPNYKRFKHDTGGA